jgi:deoxyribose-phosphate aldolase
VSGTTDPVAREEIARRIDHTLLRSDATAFDVDRHCREALEHGFAAVCVHGLWVARCAALLEGSGVRVSSVVGFPLGGGAPESKSFEARLALDQGAHEIDMMVALGALKGGDLHLVRRDVMGILDACHERGGIVKLILETASLTRAEKERASALAVECGVDFVKTSTGFGAGGATTEDVALLRRLVGPAIGVKASGGIRDLATARAMLAAGATRIGTSSSVRIVAEERR